MFRAKRPLDRSTSVPLGSAKVPYIPERLRVKKQQHGKWMHTHNREIRTIFRVERVFGFSRIGVRRAILVDERRHSKELEFNRIADEPSGAVAQIQVKLPNQRQRSYEQGPQRVGNGAAICSRYIDMILLANQMHDKFVKRHV